MLFWYHVSFTLFSSLKCSGFLNIDCVFLFLSSLLASLQSCLYPLPQKLLLLPANAGRHFAVLPWPLFSFWYRWSLSTSWHEYPPKLLSGFSFLVFFCSPATTHLHSHLLFCHPSLQCQSPRFCPESSAHLYVSPTKVASGFTCMLMASLSVSGPDLSYEAQICKWSC